MLYIEANRNEMGNLSSFCRDRSSSFQFHRRTLISKGGEHNPVQILHLKRVRGISRPFTAGQSQLLEICRCGRRLKQLSPAKVLGKPKRFLPLKSIPSTPLSERIRLVCCTAVRVFSFFRPCCRTHRLRESSPHESSRDEASCNMQELTSLTP